MFPVYIDSLLPLSVRVWVTLPKKKPQLMRKPHTRWRFIKVINVSQLNSRKEEIRRKKRTVRPPLPVAPVHTQSWWSYANTRLDHPICPCPRCTCTCTERNCFLPRLQQVEIHSPTNVMKAQPQRQKHKVAPLCVCGETDPLCSLMLFSDIRQHHQCRSTIPENKTSFSSWTTINVVS